MVLLNFKRMKLKNKQPVDGVDSDVTAVAAELHLHLLKPQGCVGESKDSTSVSCRIKSIIYIMGINRDNKSFRVTDLWLGGSMLPVLGLLVKKNAAVYNVFSLNIF